MWFSFSRTPPGITSENVAKDYGISRAVQDQFAAHSFQKAEAAQKSGKFNEEIVPVTTKWVDPKTGEEKTITVTQDDGIRPGMTAEGLSKLKPAFTADGSTHAGNASQVSDGAAAVLLARRSVAKKLGLPILGKFVTAAVVGVPRECDVSWEFSCSAREASRRIYRRRSFVKLSLNTTCLHLQHASWVSDLRLPFPRRSRRPASPRTRSTSLRCESCDGVSAFSANVEPDANLHPFAPHQQRSVCLPGRHVCSAPQHPHREGQPGRRSHCLRPPTRCRKCTRLGGVFAPSMRGRSADLALLPFTRPFILTLCSTQTGARQIATALPQAKRSGAKVFVTSMCIG